MGLRAPLWRAIAVYRVAALAHAVLLAVWNTDEYAHPAGAWVVLAVMLAWTVTTVWAYALPRWRRWPVFTADLVVVVTCLLAGAWVIGEQGQATTLPVLWVAAPVLAWAVAGGRRAGLAAAAVVAVADLVARGGTAGDATVGALNATVLLLLAGFTVGHFARLAGDAEQRLQQAAQQQAAAQERERLARGIHDSVLQVLALVQRRGAELGGEAAALGRLAGEQETTLRTLVGGVPAPTASSGVDLRGSLARLASGRVTVSTPAEPVWLPAEVASELADATAAALDNVRLHAGAGASAWVLLEVASQSVTVTVRDDGVGIPPGRLAQAAADGRMGVARSIEGRLRDLGGSATIVSAPGEGTEVELRLPLPV